MVLRAKFVCYYKQHKGDNFSIEEVKNIIADNEMKVN
ncbi:hypothetical protein JY647_06165 [Staphylococcus aureus]|nr:hypothetical protein [Staphylococcus aureus]